MYSFTLEKKMTISIKRLFIVAFLAFVLVSCVVISIISAFSITKIGTASAVNQASTVVEKALEILNGDEFERISKEMNPNDEKAENMRAELLRLAKSTSCQYLYSMIPKTDSVYTYVMDVEAGIRNEEHFTEMGTEEDISSWGTPPKKTFRDGSINHTKLEHHSEWGWQISVYGAIKNSKGKIIGLIGCDYNVDYIIRMTKKQVLLISLMGLISVILGVSTVYIFSNFLFGALDKITDAMETVSKGNADLTQRIPEQKSTELSSLAKSCNNVIERLSYLIGELQNQSNILKDSGVTLNKSMGTHIQNIGYATKMISDIEDKIASQQGKITSVSDSIVEFESQISHLNTKIISQSDAIEQASSAVEQISANIKQVNKNVTLISTDYSVLNEKSIEGNKLQQDVSERIEQIAKQSANLNEANMAISGIAEQTNLLAMNAAIEAAHAGELGKGFSVVADEIRALAETATTQSNAISELLDGIATAIKGIVESSQKSSKAFENVGSKIIEMDGLMKEIQLGMEEENAGVNDILETVKTIDGTTSAITEASETMKKESANIASQISELKKTADDTHMQSVEVLGDMMEINAGAVEASEASTKNTNAADQIIDMIIGFKIQ